MFHAHLLQSGMEWSRQPVILFLSLHADFTGIGICMQRKADNILSGSAIWLHYSH